MNIKITIINESKLLYEADCTDLPGSPPIGRGNTVYLAIGQLIAMLAYSTDTDWWKNIKDPKITIEMPKNNPAVKWQ